MVCQARFHAGVDDNGPRFEASLELRPASFYTSASDADCHRCSVNLVCAVRKKTSTPLSRYKMSSAAFATKISGSRFLPLLAAVIVLCTCMLGQTDAKPKQGKQESKKVQGSTASQGKKAEAAQTGAEKPQPSAAEEGDQEEATGPWHGLTSRP